MSEHLNSSTIQQYLAEVADELPVDGTQRVVVLVGGALLAWHDLRDATRDVDSGSRLDSEIVAAIARVASRHGLAPKWFNDSAAAFLPATFDRALCEVLIESPTLRVLGAPWDQLFLMKLNASRAIDTDDMEAIWPLCSNLPRLLPKRSSMRTPSNNPTSFWLTTSVELCKGNSHD